MKKKKKKWAGHKGVADEARDSGDERALSLFFLYPASAY